MHALRMAFSFRRILIRGERHHQGQSWNSPNLLGIDPFGQMVIEDLFVAFAACFVNVQKRCQMEIG